jgi:phospholipase C
MSRKVTLIFKWLVSTQEIINFEGRFDSPKFSPVRAQSYCVIPDPGHGYIDTGRQMYLPNDTPSNSISPEGRNISMGGFAQSYWEDYNGNPYNVMGIYEPDQVPIISTLCQSFTCCDNFYASIPGPTAPNRVFMHTGTSKGYDGGDYADPPVNATSIYEILAKNNYTWQIHFQDFTSAHGIHPLNTYVDNIIEDLDLQKFFFSVDAGTLPDYTFLVPLLSPTDDLYPTTEHPSYDLRWGEDLIKRVYERLRNSQYWNELLFVLTYDEHGGFWDKKPPPIAVDPEMGGSSSTPYEFDFQRYGIRIPTIFISPWLPKQVDHTLYDLTSILATVKDIFGVDEFLSYREETANKVTSWLNSPRNNTPTFLPNIPSDDEFCGSETSGGVSDLHKEYIEMYKKLMIKKNIDFLEPSLLRTDREAGKWLRSSIRKLFPPRK